MIKDFFLWLGVRSPLHLPAVNQKDARSRVLFAGAIAGEPTLCLGNAGNEEL